MKFEEEKELKEKLEKYYLEEEKTEEAIAELLSIPKAIVCSLVKFFRLDKSKEIKRYTQDVKEDLERKRTKEECIKEFRALKRELKRTPMLLELPKLGKSGLRRDILKYWGKFSDFLQENRLGKPRPKKGSKHGVNFARLASEAAIRYHQKGKWSKSEEKVARILREELGLIEYLDWWHNFKIRTPKGNGTFYELDFYLPRFNLVLETDSFWHGLGESKAKDELRDLWVKENLKCETLRFNKFTQKELAKIRKLLKERLKDGGRT